MSAINLLQYVQNNGSTPSMQAGNILQRPISAANGSIYIAVDEQNIYRYNQLITTWELIGTGNTLTGPFVTKWQTWENDFFVSTLLNRYIELNTIGYIELVDNKGLPSEISIKISLFPLEIIIKNINFIITINDNGFEINNLSNQKITQYFSNYIQISDLANNLDYYCDTDTSNRINNITNQACINDIEKLFFSENLGINDLTTELNNTTQQLEFKHISNNRYARYTNDFVLISDDTNNPFLGNYTQLEIAGIRFVDLNTGVTGQYYANFAVVPQITVNRVDYNAAATTPPVNTVTPAGWIDATVAGNPVKIPYYV